MAFLFSLDALAQADLLPLHVAFDHGGNAAEEISDAGHLKPVDHVRPAFPGGDYPRFLQHQKVLRDRRLVETEEVEQFGKRAFALLQHVDQHKPDGMRHRLNNLAPDFSFFERDHLRHLLERALLVNIPTNQCNVKEKSSESRYSRPAFCRLIYGMTDRIEASMENRCVMPIMQELVQISLVFKPT